MRTLLIALFSVAFFSAQQKTYCNPINVDYGYTPIPNFATQGKHRATADPVILNFKGKYYLFSTNQWGYWWSEDMSNWNFISRKFLKQTDEFPQFPPGAFRMPNQKADPSIKIYDELCAPTDRVMFANIKNYKDLNLKIYHGGMDDVVLPENAFNFWMKVHPINPKAELIIFPNDNHNSWDSTYSNPEFYKWLLSQKKK